MWPRRRKCRTVYRSLAERPGLQAERTDLSWMRTALAFFVNGALLVLRHDDLSAVGPLQLACGGFAITLGVFTLIMSKYRQHTLLCKPLPTPLAAPAPLLLIAGGTVMLGATTLAALIMF